jgi:hypothetical protein
MLRTVHGIEVGTQKQIPVVTGVLATTAGLQIAMRVQPEADGTIILPPHDATELLLHLEEAISAKLKGN